MIKAVLTLLLLLFSGNALAQSVNVSGNVHSKVSASNSSVVAAPTAVAANGTAVSVVTVTLRDSANALLPGIEVTLSSSRGALDIIGHYVGTVLTPGNSYISDGSGVVRFGVRSNTGGVSTYTAVAENLVTLNNKPLVVFIALSSDDPDPPPPPAVSPSASTVVADPTTLPADNNSISVVTVTLRASNNALLIDREVSLYSSRGSSDSIGYYIGSVFFPGNSYKTDSNGVVRFGVYSALPGDAVFTAIAQATVTLNDRPTVTFLPLPKDDPPPPPLDDDPPPGTLPDPTDEPPPRSVAERVIERVTEFIRERANDTTNRALAGLGAITTLTMLPTITTSIITALLQNVPLLNFLITSWLPIRRRNRWGTVRDKKTGAPVAGVEVVLWQPGASKPIAKYRTDQTGQYGFLVEKTGQYYLSINNPLYSDYRSEAFSIDDTSAAISFDIALLPDEVEQIAQIHRAKKYMDWIEYLNYMNVILVSVGTIVSIFVFYTDPSIFSGAILFLYAVIWGFKLFRYTKYRYYGLVVSGDDGEPIASAIVQLTGEKQGIQALIHSTITDEKGRFLFIVKPSKYSMIVAKNGFEPSEIEVDERRLTSNITLKPQTYSDNKQS